MALVHRARQVHPANGQKSDKHYRTPTPWAGFEAPNASAWVVSRRAGIERAREKRGRERERGFESQREERESEREGDLGGERGRGGG